MATTGAKTKTEPVRAGPRDGGGDRTLPTKTIRPVAIVGGVRLPFCRIGSEYKEESLLDMMIASFNATVTGLGLEKQILGEVVLGTTFYHPEYWNLAREVVLRSPLSPLTPAIGLQRACATSLEAAIALANKIALGQIEAGIAGGVESMSNMTLFLRPQLTRRLVQASRAKSVGERFSVFRGLRPGDLRPKAPPGIEPSTGKSMGEHAEMMARQWEIPREAQDELALASHRNGVQAYERGFYEGLVHAHLGVRRDNNLRVDTSLEKLADLKPAFGSPPQATLTAGNSSPLTDGAACVVLASEAWAKERGLPVLAYLTDWETTAVDVYHEGLLMAPTFAAPKMLARQGLRLQDFDLYEIHEAFAAQVLCTFKAWESEEFCRAKLGLSEALGPVDRARLNVAGGSVALGHPFGATGARILATAAKLLGEKGGGRAFASICTGGGMGTVAMLVR